MADLEAPVAENIETTDGSGDGQVQDGSSPISGSAPSGTASPKKAEEISDWTKDPNYEKSWKKDPNRLYKNYRDMEKVYPAVKKQAETLAKQFEDLGIKPEQLKEIYGKYQEWEKPENPVRQRADYFSKWLDDPLYQPSVIRMFQELEKQDLQRKYPGMNDEQIKAMSALQNQVKELSEKHQSQESEKLTKDYTNTIVSGIERAEAKAKANGFQLTEDVRNYVIDYCVENKIEPKYVYQTFLELYEKDLDKAYAAKTEKEVLGRLNKQKDSVVLGGGKAKAAAPGKPGFRESMLSAIRTMKK